MTGHLIAVTVVGAVVVGVLVWLLAQLGRVLIRIAEALAAAAVVGLVVWLVIKAVVWAVRQAATHWRTSLTVVAMLAWWQWWGWLSLALTAGVTAVVLGVWRWAARVSFETWSGRWLRSWWLRWTLYAPRLPGWLQACGLSIKATPPRSW